MKLFPCHPPNIVHRQSVNTWQNKRVLITGATAGIGKALTLALAQKGASLAICGRNTRKMESLLTELTRLKTKPIIAETFDASCRNSIEQFTQKALEALNGIDILINNAGLNSARGNIEDIALSDWETMLAINSTAPLIFSQGIIPVMKEQRAGTIINILSTVCLFSSPKLASYTASKYAALGMTNVMRKELRPHNVKVMGIFPGGVDSDFRPHSNTDYLRPENVAQAIISQLELPQEIALDELVLRPMIENNFT